MDTKWTRKKAVISLLAFVVGINLTVIFSGLAVLLMIDVGPRRVMDAFQGDYQKTRLFRTQTGCYLEALISYALEVDGDGRAAEAVRDENIRYEIWNKGVLVASKTSGIQGSLENREQDGYNFYLQYRDGAVQIWKDGAELDLYGDGFYREGWDQWRLPGYSNLDTGSFLRLAYPEEWDWSGIVIQMAVAEKPLDYGDSSGMYYVSDSMVHYRREVYAVAIPLLLGLALTIWSILWRRHLRQALQTVGGWTGQLWLEIKLLLLAPLLLMCYGAVSAIYYLFWYRQLRGGPLVLLPIAFCGALLYCNDAKWNWDRLRIHSFCGWLARQFRTGEDKLALQTRIRRRAVIMVTAAAVLAAGVAVCDILLFRQSWRHRSIAGVAVSLLMGVLGLAIFVWLRYFWRREKELSEDLGRLWKQVEAVRSGDYSAKAEIPEDGDLAVLSQALREIQSGLENALEERTRSERMKVELITNVSHDLKTPLTSILSYADLLDGEDLPDHVRDYVTILRQKAFQLRDMVQEVFEVSKASSGELSLRWEALDLAKLLRQTLADLAEPIAASTLVFRPQLPEEPVMVWADGDRLYRVFQNLIQNTLQYAMEGSRVYVVLRVQDNSAVVRVQNISREELPQGVDFTARFVRGDASRTDGGSGLGLAIASSFTRACGGAFQVEINGDLFTAEVVFPLYVGPEPPVAGMSEKTV
ncbi:sensor histidine kinase [Pseudoflavonifractor sp. 524-17]|uniref:sensor histidine kinase n=1 Tax=Pseudoflavonifractor sp. 524-17 TaxID=2304577 RepID=UPI00137B6F60|nr:HAMP domain-containing sensor histidine kinase [Pseudoflavonifractor sp. 524-17]NCE63291.1 sensor histidine kinase [Pseudoflavonifractor sp. 524-17]